MFTITLKNDKKFLCDNGIEEFVNWIKVYHKV